MANDCKFVKLETKVSYDAGASWESQNPPVYHKGGLIETHSYDCGGEQDIDERWIEVDDDYLCVGYNKYKKEILEVSYDGGVIWYPSYPLAVRLGEYVGYDERYCAYAAEVHYWVNEDYGCPYGCPSGYECRLVNGTYDCYREQNTYNTTPTRVPRRHKGLKAVDPLKIIGCPNSTLTKSLLESLPYAMYYLKIGQCAYEIADGVASGETNSLRAYFEYLDTTDAINLTRIGNFAFYGCNGVLNGEQVSNGLQSVIIPSGVTSIGNGAFDSCSGMTDVTISNAPCSIGSRAFADCLSLSGLTLGNSITNIGVAAFEGCINITSNITIPSTVVSIGGGAFRGCSGITNITIQEGVTSIGNGALNNTSITDLTIPNSATAATFPDGCQYLTGVTIGSGISAVILDDIAASPVKYLSLNCKTLRRRTISQRVNLPFEEVILGNNVSGLTNEEFFQATSLITIEFGSNITTIGDYTFYECQSLTSVTIPSGVTSIGYQAFQGCTSLTSVTIPSGVTSIGNDAFWGCSGLTSVTIEATTPPTLGTDAFYHTNCPIYVPCSSLSSYLGASGWSDYSTRIVGIPPCGGNEPKYVFTLTGGSVVSAVCDSTSSITTNDTSSYKRTMTSVEIGSCVSSIDNEAFRKFSGLTSCTMGSGVTSIGEKAFRECAFGSIIIPSGITNIGNQAFYSCTRLTSVTCLATTPPTLGTEAFDYNASGRKIYVPSESVSIYQSASGWSSYASNIEAIPT